MNDFEKLQIEAEASALKERFQGVNRSKFAREFNVPGGQAMVYQHINAIKPISLEAGLAYAKGFKVPLSKISERLAKSAQKAATFLEQPTQTNFDENVSASDVGIRKIPLIDYVRAGELAEVANPFPIGEAYDWLLTDLDLSDRAFALEIEGNSMEPEFKAGDRVIIDPSVSPHPGDFVVAKNHDEKATFKKYRLRGIDETGKEVFELIPLNSDYPTLRSDEIPLRIIGTMMEHRKYRRR